MKGALPNGVWLLTAPGPGGVAVVEVRGAEALARLAALAGGRTARPGEVRLVRLARPSEALAGAAETQAASEDLDEALLVGVGGGVSVGAGPDTGAEAPIVELHLHGSPPLVDEVLQLLGGDAATLATRAATFEARAEARLADVPTELGARVLVDQAHGALRRELAALSSVSPAARSARLASLVARTDTLRALFVPVRVVLAGPVNAGKSTLFNLLAGEERAVVSPEPGTTRDALGADLTLGPYALRLVDTAGARELDGAGPGGIDLEVERAGQAVARVLVATADVVVHLARMGEAQRATPVLDAWGTARRHVTLRTCADLVFGHDPAGWPTDGISVSAAPAESRSRVEAALLAALALPRNPDWVRGEAVLCEAALRDEAQRLALQGACDDAALAHIVALLDS